MSVELPPEPRRKRRTQVLAEVGQPIDRDAGRVRLANFRAKKKKKKVTVGITARVDVRLANAVREIEERFDVTASSILKRFIEDGVKKYTPDLCEIAGIVEAANPFSSFPAERFPVNVNGPQYVPKVVNLPPPDDDPTLPSSAAPPLQEVE